MDFLPFDPSDSEDEMIEQQLLSPTTSPQPTITNKFHPVWERTNNDSTTIPADCTLILATDIATSAFLLHTSSSFQPCLTLTSTILPPRKPHAATSPNTSNSTPNPSTSNSPPKQIIYSFTNIPNTPIIIGTTNVDPPVTYGNHIAEFIFHPTSSKLPAIKSCYILNAQSFTSLSSSVQDKLHAQHTDQQTNNPKYPITFQLSTSPFNPALNLEQYPSYMGNVSGFFASLVTTATIHNVKFTAIISILNPHYLSELFFSFERTLRLATLQQAGLPSIYGQVGEKLPKSVVTATLKALIDRFQVTYAAQQRILPHAKQSGLPASVFL